MTRFPLCPHRLIVVALTSLLVGCSTDPAFFDAEAQRHLANQAPIFTCDKCEGVTLRSQIPSAPTIAPTNGWDAAKSIAGSVSNIVTGQAGTILAGYAINALSTTGQPINNPAPVIVNPGAVTTTTTTGDTINTYSADQRTESTVTTSSTSNTLQNSGQMAGGDASVANSYNPHTETHTDTTNNSNNPTVTTITDTEQAGVVP